MASTTARLTGSEADLWVPHVPVWVPDANGVRDVYFAARTGTHVVVIDADATGERAPGGSSSRWQTWCNEHDQTEEWLSLRVARREAAAPEGWCERCMEIEAALEDEDDEVEIGAHCDVDSYVMNNGFLYHRLCGADGCPGIDR